MENQADYLLLGKETAFPAGRPYKGFSDQQRNLVTNLVFYTMDQTNMPCIWCTWGQPAEVDEGCQ